jgi:hypothetical protein
MQLRTQPALGRSIVRQRQPWRDARDQAAEAFEIGDLGIATVPRRAEFGLESALKPAARHRPKHRLRHAREQVDHVAAIIGVVALRTRGSGRLQGSGAKQRGASRAGGQEIAALHPVRRYKAGRCGENSSIRRGDTDLCIGCRFQ